MMPIDANSALYFLLGIITSFGLFYSIDKIYSTSNQNRARNKIEKFDIIIDEK